MMLLSKKKKHDKLLNLLSSKLDANARKELNVEKNHLRFVTYNVWFGKRTETPRELEPRLGPLFDIIKSKNPDFICLQEMTQPIITLLRSQAWIRESYWISDTIDIRPTGYGIVMLSIHPCIRLYTVRYESKLGRTMIFGKFLVNNEIVLVATNHLESYDDSHEIRRKQMSVAYTIFSLDNSDHIFYMGDFNFRNSKERKKSLRKKFEDAWLQCKGDSDLGYTVDPTRNIMLKEMNPMSVFKHERVDVVFYRSNQKKWEIEHMQLLGTEPITGTDSNRLQQDFSAGGSKPPAEDNPEASAKTGLIFPSDHFGIYSCFKYVAAREGGNGNALKQ